MSADEARVMRLATGAALLGAALCLALFGLRAAGSLSFTVPLQVHATGDEFTNYFNIWKAMTGEVVYNDRFQAPYSATVYNWLFYHAYAAFDRVVMAALGLDGAWLPTVSRWFTLLAIACGLGASYLTFRRAARAEDVTGRALCAAFAVMLMMGPLLGFWSLTVRADLWAMTLEIAGTGLFLALYPRRRMGAVLVLAAAVYLAWSFKQGNVFAAAGGGLVLLLRRDWKALALLCTVLPGAWALTMTLGEPQWLNNILFRDFPLFMSWQRMARNLANVAVKTGPVLLGVAALLAVAVRSKAILLALWRSDTVLFAVGGTLAALMLSVPISAQHGGAENYFFTLTFFLALLLMAALPALRAEPRALRPVLAATAAGWAILTGAVLLVVGGVAGKTDLRDQHATYETYKRCTDALPRPLFINIPYMGLPWMTPGNTPWVLSYTYHEERALGVKPFEHGGIGGLIETGAFAAIAVPAEGTPPTGWDGGSLAGYEHRAVADCPQNYVFFRKDR